MKVLLEIELKPRVCLKDLHIVVQKEMIVKYYYFNSNIIMFMPYFRVRKNPLNNKARCIILFIN